MLELTASGKGSAGPFLEPVSKDSSLEELIQSIAKKGLYLDMQEYKVKGIKRPKGMERVVNASYAHAWNNLKAAEKEYRKAIRSLSLGLESPLSKFEARLDLIRDEELRLRANVISRLRSQIQMFQESGIAIAYNVEKKDYEISSYLESSEQEVQAFREKFKSLQADPLIDVSRELILYIFSKEVSEIKGEIV